MIKKEYTVLTPHGLHARPAKAFLNLVKNASADVALETEANRCDAKSMLGILSLQAGYNTKITVEINGEDEAALATRLDRFFLEEIINL